MNDDVEKDHSDHLQSIDPLLPRVAPLEAMDGETVLRVERGSGVALGLVRSSQTAAEAPEALWGALHKHSLEIRLAGPDREAALEALLDDWLAGVETVEEAGDWDSSATVTVPSRDPVYANALMRRGFGPNNTTAARRRGATGPLGGPSELGDGLRIRHAQESDLGAIADHDVQLMHHDTQFGGVTERPGARAVLLAVLEQRFGAAPDWTWVIEQDDRVIGFAHVMPPECAGWTAGYSSFGAEAAYFMSMYIDPSVRGGQLGARLAQSAHDALDARGVPLTTLSHAVPNPQSTPFWARMGYRPLWTSWQRRPARLH